MNLPEDPIILLSYINTQLRDHYASLEELCKSLCVKQQILTDRLSAIGYQYNQEQNKFL